jgi:hypothetical protein
MDVGGPPVVEGTAWFCRRTSTESIRGRCCGVPADRTETRIDRLDYPIELGVALPLPFS